MSAIHEQKRKDEHTNLYGLLTMLHIRSHHSRRPFPPCCTFATFAPYSRAYRGVTSRAYPSSSNASTYTIRFSTRSGLLLLLLVASALGFGVGSNALRLFTITRTGSTGIQRASAREKTSVQNTGAVSVGSGVRSPVCRVFSKAYPRVLEAYATYVSAAAPLPRSTQIPACSLLCSSAA